MWCDNWMQCTQYASTKKTTLHCWKTFNCKIGFVLLFLHWFESKEKDSSLLFAIFLRAEMCLSISRIYFWQILWVYPKWWEHWNAVFCKVCFLQIIPALWHLNQWNSSVALNLAAHRDDFCFCYIWPFPFVLHSSSVALYISIFH